MGKTDIEIEENYGCSRSSTMNSQKEDDDGLDAVYP